MSDGGYLLAEEISRIGRVDGERNRKAICIRGIVLVESRAEPPVQGNARAFQAAFRQRVVESSKPEIKRITDISRNRWWLKGQRGIQSDLHNMDPTSGRGSGGG